MFKSLMLLEDNHALFLSRYTKMAYKNENKWNVTKYIYILVTHFMGVCKYRKEGEVIWILSMLTKLYVTCAEVKSTEFIGVAVIRVPSTSVQGTLL